MFSLPVIAFAAASRVSRLHRLPPASPELVALASEGGTLEQRAREGATQLAKLRSETASLEWSTTGLLEQQKGRLQQERRALLERLGDLEASEHSLRSIALEAAEQLEAERRQAEDRAFGQEAALSTVAQRLSAAEQRWSGARATARQLKSEASAAEAAAATALRGAGREAEKDGRVVRELQKRLERQKRETQKAEEIAKERLELEKAEEKKLELEAAEPLKDLEAELQQCEKLRRAESKLAARLEETRLRSDHIEKKAMNVARELVDSSKAIAWLQSEVSWNFLDSNFGCCFELEI